MSNNAEQIDFWNGPSGERWAYLADVTERHMTYITAALMPLAAAKPGERVVDIGCGCGATTRALAKAVGAKGNVMGIDVSRPMLMTAREKVNKDDRISFVEADASQYPFKPEFELAFSRFGVMFFTDPPTAFANIRKALVSSGRLVFVCWRSLAENVWAARLLDATRDLLPPQPPMDPVAPGPFALADAKRLRSILTQAGFIRMHLEKLDTLVNMGATIDAALRTALGFGPLARLTSNADEQTRRKLEERIRMVLANFATPAGIAPPAACWLVSAEG